MIHRLRRRHLATFLVLGAFLIALLVTALTARQPLDDYLGHLVETSRPTASEPGD